MNNTCKQCFYCSKNSEVTNDYISINNQMSIGTKDKSGYTCCNPYSHKYNKRTYLCDKCDCFTKTRDMKNNVKHDTTMNKLCKNQMSLL